MPVTNYITVNGQLTGEITNGVRTQYMTDALGSVIRTTDGSGYVLNTYRYAPYGGKTYKTGTSPDPKFLFAGTWGGRQTGRAHSEEYWRARHRSEPETTWTTVDPHWPNELPYIYGKNAPCSQIDPAGSSSCDSNIVDSCAPPKVRDGCFVCGQSFVGSLTYINSYPLPIWGGRSTCVRGTLTISGTWQLSMICPPLYIPVLIVSTVSLSVKAVSGTPPTQVWGGWNIAANGTSGGPTPPDFDTLGGNSKLAYTRCLDGTNRMSLGHENFEFRLDDRTTISKGVHRSLLRVHPIDSGMTLGCEGITYEADAKNFRLCMQTLNVYGVTSLPHHTIYTPG